MDFCRKFQTSWETQEFQQVLDNSDGLMVDEEVEIDMED